MATGMDVGEITGLEGDLGWALGRVFRAYLKAFHAALDDLPGGPRGYQILTLATHGTPQSQLALAQHLGIDRTVMTYLLDDLVDAGLVERRSDPADRRVRHVVATAKGRDLLCDLERHIAHAEEHLLAPLSERDRDTLRTLLRHVALHVESHDPVSDECSVVHDIEQAGKHS